jgi:hypothetical protein
LAVHESGSCRTTYIRTVDAMNQVVASAKRTRRRLDASHAIAAILGLSGLFLSRGIATTGTVAYALPIASGVLTAWFLAGFLPRWVPAVFAVSIAVLAVWNVRRIGNAQRARQEALMLGYALGDVCDGKPLDRAPTGPAVRIYDRFRDGKYWLASNASATGIPRFVLCNRHTSYEVACGDYEVQGRPEDGTRQLCTSREDVTAELRRTQTAEVVFAKTYAGDAPKELSSYVQLGGPGHTQLTGDVVGYEAIYADIKPFLDEP